MSSEPFNFAFYGLWGALLFAPPMAWVFAMYVRRRGDIQIRRFVVGCVAVLLVMTLSSYGGLRFSSLQKNVVTLIAAYFVFFCLVGLASRSKTLFIKVPAITAGVCVGSVGYQLGSIGLLGLAFIVGDYIPQFATTLAPGISCTVTTYGNVTTSAGGYVVRIEKQWLLPFLVTVVGQQRFELTTGEPVSPQESCLRASAAHVSQPR